jgi:hypothetical protein
MAGLGSPVLARLEALGGGEPVLQRDNAFEARLRASERTILQPRFQDARAWYSVRPSRSMIPVPNVVTPAVAPFPSPDGDVWFRLVNSVIIGIPNAQQVFGTEFPGWVRDWSMSHATDDVAATTPEFQQPSWNWHNIYADLDRPAPYPLPVQTMVNATPYSGSVVAGGSTFFKLGVAPAGTATITLTSPAAGSANLQLVLVRSR